MNDPKNNWFYKLCKKQCKKDILWLVLAPVCFALAIYLFLSGDGILSALLFIGLGAGMIYIGADALLFKLPKVKERLEKMNPYEYACLGESAPECINKTFYFTEKYLCAPLDYAIVPYEHIKSMTLKQKTVRGRVTGAYIEVEFDDGSPQKMLVSNNKRFLSQADAFAEHVRRYKADIVINKE